MIIELGIVVFMLGISLIGAARLRAEHRQYHYLKKFRLTNE
jgi:hypothetical protein